MPEVSYDVVKSVNELEQILELQACNLSAKIAEAEKASQGFVSVHHTLELLKAMNTPYPHVIARDGEIVVGYCLVMLREFEASIPMLQPMFQKINELVYEGKKLATASYFVMGQICIAGNQRGKGIFDGLYAKLKEEMVSRFDYIITEVSRRNLRSIRAHERVGFKNICEYVSSADNEHWIIYLWDWKNRDGL